jgi:hypothetical protein
VLRFTTTPKGGNIFTPWVSIQWLQYFGPNKTTGPRLTPGAIQTGVQRYKGHEVEMNTKVFYVGVFLDERIFFAPYGFTNYADCYIEAEDMDEARTTAKQFFESKHKVGVNGTRLTVATNYNPDEVIKPVKTATQTEIFNPIKTNNEQTRIFPNAQKITLATFLLSRLFSK